MLKIGKTGILWKYYCSCHNCGNLTIDDEGKCWVCGGDMDLHRKKIRESIEK